MKRIIVACTMIFMIFSLCACAKKTKQYELFASENSDVCVSNTVMGLSSTLKLYKDGSGDLEYAGQRTVINTWEIKNGTVTLTGEGKTITGTENKGILKLDFGDGVYGYYAEPGTDISSVKVMSEEDFKTYVRMVNEGMPEGYLKEVTESGSGLAKKLGVKSDEKHFVAQMTEVLLVYDLDGDRITGCTGYFEAADEETAKKAVETYSESDPTIESVRVDGNVIVITYTGEAYKDMTSKELEESLGAFKIE